MRIVPDDLTAPAVRDLIAEHLDEMYATSPAESVHAMPLAALESPDVTVWSAWDGDEVLGCGALKHLEDAHGEIKSMRTHRAARGQGVGAAILATILAEASARGYRRVSLETGSQDHFAPARRLYARHGFEECPPFADYTEDPNSVFMTRQLTPEAPEAPHDR
ncbi:GNAT family N-acetyltransferase [Microbacterium sp. Marseille-Q6965]|uniref:GNAT family N-acetyltransferase n=1 Tax=Microbacterium sp. Marseille-Q6965 TaxID=2965072 RepID=UPI0021B7F65A|nr:GNAT family N-acetyltransferase [Microbacterium sp. Marseille-Q6965]